MSDSVLFPDLWQDCSSDVSGDSWLATSWDQANSDVTDWLDRTLWSMVSGQLTVRGVSASREILVLSVNQSPIQLRGNVFDYHVWANSVSGADGSFDLQWDGYAGNVIVMYLDDLGLEWQPETSYVEGDLIYPSVWNGWQYECVAAGTTDSTEPSWWQDEGATAFSGTAAFKARQYLPALADGPITPYQWSE